MKTKPNDLAFDGTGDFNGHNPENMKNGSLTKREYFAAQALGSALEMNFTWSSKKIAQLAISVADALIEELNKDET